MATIKTARQLAAEARYELESDHRRRCASRVFPSSDKKNRSITYKAGDIARCEHGEIMVYKYYHRWEGVKADTLSKKRHPILYRRAVIALELEEAMRAEERDGGD